MVNLYFFNVMYMYFSVICPQGSPELNLTVKLIYRIQPRRALYFCIVKLC